jgi:hypothetical protein
MVFGIVKKVLPIAAIGLGLFFLTNVLLRPAQAQQSTDVLSSFGVGLGSGLSSVGAGVQTFLTGIGTGSAQLLNPLFSLKTLFYGDDANAVIEQTENASSTSRRNPIPNTASDSPGVTIQGGGGSDNTGGTRTSSSYGGAGQHGFAHASSVGRFAN